MPPDDGNRPAVKERQGHATVQVTKSRLGLADQEQVKEYVLDAMDVGDSPASVNVAVSVTHNTGRYESVRISCGVTLPCRPTDTYRAAHVSRLIAQDLHDAAADEWFGTDNGRRSPSYAKQPDEWKDDPA